MPRSPLLVSLVLWILPLTLHGQAPSRLNFDFDLPQKGEVTVSAAHQEYLSGLYAIWTGDVVVTYGDITIHADKITRNQKTDDIVAEGRVIVDQGTRRLTAQRMAYNLQSETGTLFDATGSLEPDIYFRGEKIEKISEDTYRLTNGIFTSCDIDNPAWSFEVASGEITTDDYARLRNVSFRTGRLPVLWTPYLVWPTKDERARGFLTPRVGFDSRLGSYLGSSYFIPIGPSADVTIIGDLHTNGYYGIGTETRYVPTTLINGELETYAVTDPDTDRLEWKGSYTHAQEGLPGGFRGVVDIRDYSDIDFFRFFERDFEINTLSNIYSSAYLTRNRSNYSLNIRADRREQFTGFGNSETFEQLPAIQFNTYPTRISGTPLYYSMETSASHLRTSFGAEYYRADLFPTLSMQLRTPPWLSVKPQVSLRETFYSQSRDPLTRALVDEELSRSYTQGQVEAIGPSLSRIFDSSFGGFSKFKHVIEPRFRYLYTSDVEDQDRVIRFDTVDSPYLPLVGQTIEYALVNRLIAREAGETGNAREVLSLAVRQTASLADPFVQFIGSQRIESDRTPIQVDLHLNPYQSIAFDAGVEIGNVTQQVDQVNLSANLTAPGGRQYLNFTWFARLLAPGATTGDSSQFRVSTGLPLWKDKLRLDASINYDATREEFLEQRYFTRFNASCYNIGLEFRDFLEYRTGAPRRNRDYRLSIDLKNVGSIPINLPGSLGNIFRF
ncbi:MAG TPA: LPS assembly protein LptD [Thermoanaerobaculia bacterium]|nr:LPS assembly protein LptD [Thermoanaerobaculia bacterium]